MLSTGGGWGSLVLIYPHVVPPSLLVRLGLVDLLQAAV